MKDIAIESSNKRKKLITKISAIFFGVLVLLTFFSNTINNFSLPRVKVERPSNGYLLKVVKGEGYVKERETVKIYSQSSRKVVDVLVRTGSIVKKGDIIIILDKSELNKKLKEESIQLKKMKLVLEKLNMASEQNELVDARRDIDAANETLEYAKKKLDNSKSLFDSGAISRDEYEKSQQDYKSAKAEYEKKLNAFETNKSNNGLDIKEKQYDLELQQIKVDGIKKELESESEIKAPCDGIIKEINIEKGSLTDPQAAMCTVVDISKGFEFRAVIDVEEAGLVSVNDSINISLKASKDKILEGKLIEIRNAAESDGKKKELVISIPREGLSGEEAGSILISKQSRQYDILVPNSSVGQDSKGKFVYVLKGKKGPLGNEYYIQRASIKVDDSDSFNSAVLDGVGTEERIVVYSSKDNLADGCRVMIER